MGNFTTYNPDLPVEFGTWHTRLTRFVDEMEEAAKHSAEIIADDLTEYAKAHHPWQNDTGETERTTQGIVHFTKAHYVYVSLQTGTPYSLFLELAHNGKWAWLFAALLANQAKMLETWKREMGS